MCAPRFEFFAEKGILLNARCPLGCGEIDSLDHPIKCVCYTDPDPETPFDDKIHYQSTVAIEAAKNCPILPTPILLPPSPDHIEAGEISLEDTPSEVAPGERTHPHSPDQWSLEFDLDSDAN